MRKDACVFILSHGRPDRVHTLASMAAANFTGAYYIVIDDEDSTGAAYRERYGDKVLTFSKAKVAETFDEADNFGDRRTIVYARNQCLHLARALGYRYYVQFDDDYTGFMHRVLADYRPGYAPIDDLSAVLDAFIEYLAATPRILTVAMSQGGDHSGGAPNVVPISMRRKAMNSFVCSVDRPVQFSGRVNEDVNTYTMDGRRGRLFLTVMGTMLVQKQTQSNAGGMTDIYLDSGTYVKSFYSVIHSPSCVRVGVMGDPAGSNGVRLHHDIDWRYAVPKIIREKWRSA